MVPPSMRRGKKQIDLYSNKNPYHRDEPISLIDELDFHMNFVKCVSSNVF